MNDGIVFVTGRYGQPMPLRESSQRLYVDPRTGILRKNKHYESWSRKHREMRAAADWRRASL